MPEGPETHRMADRLRRVLAGHPAREVAFAFPHLQRFEACLRDELVCDVAARGKALLTQFANGLAVYSHNQLYGRWLVRRSGERPRTGRSLRFALDNATHAALLYSASEIDVLEVALLERHPYLAGLGPDALDPELEARAVEERLASRTFHRRRLGALLLDQGFVAGLGNYLRADILFQARLHPALRPVDLEAGERRRLASAVLTIARRAYRRAGVTNDPARVRRLRDRGLPRRAWRHLVFDREGEACWTCGGTVRRLDAAGRRTYVCPRCQGDGVPRGRARRRPRTARRR